MSLPELPKPVDGERPAPLDRYMTQQITRAVPQPQPAWHVRARTAASRASRRFAALPTKTRIMIGAGCAAFVLLVLAMTAGDGEQATASPAVADGVFSAAAPAGADSEWMQAQIDSWKNADLAPGGFADVDAKQLGAQRCQGGSASAIELTLCEFATPAAADQARRVAEKSIGKNTGLVVADGERMLILADRRGADPSGKTINKLATSFGRR